ncbi:MAG: metallo-beta-lactamase superfamily protein [Acidobacteria bacterium]|nr:metallo-beta-lactamase superfamily protein [Acidobacteriota bacterium]
MSGVHPNDENNALFVSGERTYLAGMELHSLASDVELAIGQTYHANSLIVTNGAEVVLVDALGSVADAEQLRERIAASGRRVRFIISSHYFSDHMAGFRLFPEAQVIAHRNYRQTFERERFRTVEEAAHFVEPSIVIGDELTLRWGRNTLRLFANPGHTESTIGVDIPEADLVHGGDTVVGNIVYIAYSSLDAMVAPLQRLRATGRSRLLTSHGDVGSIEAIDHALFYIDALRRQTRTDDAETLLALPIEACLPEHVSASNFERIFHRRNVEMLSDALRGAA